MPTNAMNVMSEFRSFSLLMGVRSWTDGHGRHGHHLFVVMTATINTIS